MIPVLLRGVRAPRSLRGALARDNPCARGCPSQSSGIKIRRQMGMAAEANAEKVVHLALRRVGRRPQAGQRWARRAVRRLGRAPQPHPRHASSYPGGDRPPQSGASAASSRRPPTSSSIVEPTLFEERKHIQQDARAPPGTAGFQRESRAARLPPETAPPMPLRERQASRAITPPFARPGRIESCNFKIASRTASGVGGHPGT